MIANVFTSEFDSASNPSILIPAKNVSVQSSQSLIGRFLTFYWSDSDNQTDEPSGYIIVTERTYVVSTKNRVLRSHQRSLFGESVNQLDN